MAQWNVRKTNDYVPKMIELAGGKYIFDKLGDTQSKSSSVTMQMEEFYASAKDVDRLIYNSTIDGQITSIDELVAKNQLLADFKAVQSGNVWCTTQNMYQESMALPFHDCRHVHTAFVTDVSQNTDTRYLFKSERMILNHPQGITHIFRYSIQKGEKMKAGRKILI